MRLWLIGLFDLLFSCHVDKWHKQFRQTYWVITNNRKQITWRELLMHGDREKWPSVCRRHFQMHFAEWKLFNRKYKDYVYRKMLVQEYLKKWRIFKRVKPKNDMMYHDIYIIAYVKTQKNKIHNPLSISNRKSLKYASCGLIDHTMCVHWIR